jgi:hypothetical protein
MGYMATCEALQLIEHYFGTITDQQQQAFAAAWLDDCVSPAALEALCAECEDVSSLLKAVSVLISHTHVSRNDVMGDDVRKPVCYKDDVTAKDQNNNAEHLGSSNGSSSSSSDTPTSSNNNTSNKPTPFGSTVSSSSSRSAVGDAASSACSVNRVGGSATHRGTDNQAEGLFSSDGSLVLTSTFNSLPSSDKSSTTGTTTTSNGNIGDSSEIVGDCKANTAASSKEVSNVVMLQASSCFAELARVFAAEDAPAARTGSCS